MKSLLYFICLTFLFSSCHSTKEIFYFTNGIEPYQAEIKGNESYKEMIYSIYDYLLKYKEFEYSCTPAFYEDIDDLSLEELTQNIFLYQTVYDQIKVPQKAFWEKVKAEKIHAFQQRARLRMLTLQSFKNPSILWEFEAPLNSYAYHYRSLVFSNDSLKMADAVCDLQEQYFDFFRDETHDINRLRYYLISLGWWHEAEKLLPKPTDSQTLFQEFIKLLKKVKKVDLSIDKDE